MLPENFDTKIKDTSKLLSKLIDEITFSDINRYVNSSKEIHEKITAGGFRIIKQNEETVRKKLILSANSKNLLDIFFLWYQKQRENWKSIDEYFNSEEYKLIRKERNIEEGLYTLPEHKFLEFLMIVKPEHSGYFLFFSPILFDNSQARILENICLNHFNFCENLESILRELTNEKNNLKKENTILESEQKKLLKEKEQLVKNELELKSKLIKIKFTDLRSVVEKIKKEHSSELLKLQSEITHLQEEIKTIESTKSEIDRENHKLKNKMEMIENQNANLTRKFENLKIEKEKPFTEILSKINLYEIITTLNEPDEVKEFLEKSLIRSNEDKAYSDNNFEKFWESCECIERENVNKVKKLMIRDIHSDNFVGSWDPDLFNDIKFSLRARAVIINLLGEMIREKLG